MHFINNNLQKTKNNSHEYCKLVPQHTGKMKKLIKRY